MVSGRRTAPSAPGAALMLLVMLYWSVATAAADEGRGRILYENECAGCHDKRVHTRGRRLPATLADLQREVERWQQIQNLRWSREDTADVVDYLNASQYRF